MAMLVATFSVFSMMLDIENRKTACAGDRGGAK